MNLDDILDSQSIQALINDWAAWRDTGAWDKLRTIWHGDGRIHTTWFRGTAEEFVCASMKSSDRGVSVLHFLGGTSFDIQEDRAIAQTRMTISQRAEVHGVLCDCVCTGRFYDFFEKRQGKWGLVFRQPIYERDRIDSLSSEKHVVLHAEKLNAHPEGYRHLAYVQSLWGIVVPDNLPTLKSSKLELLYALGDRWTNKENLSATFLSDALAI